MKNFFMKMGYKFNRFMVGRYGIDELYKALLILYFILIIINMVLARITRAGYYITWGIATMVVVFAFYRVFSRKVEIRRSENKEWLKMTYKARSTGKLIGDKWKYRKTHVFKKCPKCKAVLRLPRKKGTHTVCCPHCHNDFNVKVR